MSECLSYLDVLRVYAFDPSKKVRLGVNGEVRMRVRVCACGVCVWCGVCVCARVWRVSGLWWVWWSLPSHYVLSNVSVC